MRLRFSRNERYILRTVRMYVDGRKTILFFYKNSLFSISVRV